MPCIDKSEEFSHVVLSLGGNYVPKTLSPYWNLLKLKFGKSYFDFIEETKKIGKNICLIQLKLERLKHLAKQKSLFNDDPLEIESLINLVKSEIENQMQLTSTLHSLALGNISSISSSHDARAHCSNAILSLQSKLASVSEDFRQILELRNENERQMTDRKEQFQLCYLSSTFPQGAVSGSMGSVLLTEQISLNMNPEALLNGQTKFELIDQSEDFLYNRAQSMHQIESTIVELGKVFQHLAIMVREQEETIRRIDGNILNVDMDVKSAHDEILRYSQKIMSNRWLMVKIFGTLAFISTCFFIFIA